jgi:hypothetical protein
MDRAFNGPIVPTHTLARSATPKSRPVTVIDLPPVAAATPGDAAWTTGVSTHETETFADSSAVDTAASSCSCVPNAPARSATDPSASAGDVVDHGVAVERTETRDLARGNRRRRPPRHFGDRD